MCHIAKNEGRSKFGPYRIGKQLMCRKQLIVTASACIPVLFACIDRVCRNEYAKLLVHVTKACYELVPRFQIDLWKNVSAYYSRLKRRFCPMADRLRPERVF